MYADHPAARPVVILLLVLTEVGLWQWRVLLTARGRRAAPALLGVLGAVLQVTAIAQVVDNLNDPLTVAAYAAGVGGGVLMGVVVAARFTTQDVRLNLVTVDATLEARLRAQGWPVIAYEGRAAAGAVSVLEVVVEARRGKQLRRAVDALAPQARWTMDTVAAGA
ncbi:DUF5698 domain-containing protein [Spongisporangium articulatum]|uniref:DUF5698 domain-containing protein n=1 Tax=Spongisporangium articulatum TaxID=3362603 RepID=A0ABW8AQ15_9ACTN